MGAANDRKILAQSRPESVDFSLGRNRDETAQEREKERKPLQTLGEATLAYELKPTAFKRSVFLFPSVVGRQQAMTAETKISNLYSYKQLSTRRGQHGSNGRHILNFNS